MENRNNYKVDVYRLPKIIDEAVARLHLDHLGVKLTKLTQEQADYIGVPIGGPYKPEHYKYWLTDLILFKNLQQVNVN